jgi:hypothetical protein
MIPSAGRERLEQLARQKRQERQQQAAQREQERAIERAKTAELYGWCQETFDGYLLTETRHELCVSRAAWAVNVCSYLGDTRLPPGAEYVSLAVPHAGPGGGDEQRLVLLLLARFTDSQFEVLDEERALCLRCLEEAQDYLVNFVADLGGERLGRLFERVRREAARCRPGGPT